jgi:8-amino-7-oxononanoate synthase
MSCRLEPPATAPPPPPAALPEPLGWIAAALDRLRAAGLERPRRVRAGRQGATVELDGRSLVNLGSNDYLGYAGDVRLTKAASKAACAEGFGAGASPLVSGHSQAHERLERAIADLLDAPAAVTFPSGFAANAATIAALVGPDDAIFSDARNHASIIDGCRLSRAAVHIYPHRDLAALETLLASTAGAGRRLIVTDTLFSMDGTIAPLADLCDLARRHAAMLMVDEAHATGVFGPRGSGLVEHARCAAGVHIRTGTLSKALGAAGGFVAGHPDLVHWLRHAARGWQLSWCLLHNRWTPTLATHCYRRRDQPHCGNYACGPHHGHHQPTLGEVRMCRSRRGPRLGAILHSRRGRRREFDSAERQ